MTSAVIVVPVYKKQILDSERASLIQAAKVLSRYKFVFVCPEGLDMSEYQDIMIGFNSNFSIERFSSEFFDSIKSYCKLMLSVDFYKRFDAFDYMLIYQLDAWVFRDELEYWCNCEYDYIGAPWFEGFDNADETSAIKNVAGNGGFSLRKISSFIEILSLFDSGDFNNLKVQTFSEIYKDYGQNRKKIFKVLKHFLFKKNSVKYYFHNVYEDLVVVKCFKKIKSDFKLADYNVGMKFSFEVLPERLYRMNNNQLPFGCHAFLKYDYNFWKQFINIDENISNEKVNI